MDRREHRTPRRIALAVARLDAGAAPVLEHESRTPAGRRAPCEPWSSRKRVSASVSAPEPPRGTDQLRPWRPKMIEYALTPGAGGVHRHERLERLPDHERLDVAVLELAPDHVPRGDRVAPQPDAAARVLEQHLLERGAEAGRRDARPAEDALDLVVLGDQAAVRLGVARARSARSPSQVRSRSSHIVSCSPSGNATCPTGSGSQVLEPVVGVEAELVVRSAADSRG